MNRTVFRSASFFPLSKNHREQGRLCSELKKHAVNGLAARAEIAKLRAKPSAAEQAAAVWKQRYDALHEKYETLKKKVQPYLAALKAAPEKVRAFIDAILARARENPERNHPSHSQGRDMEI